MVKIMQVILQTLLQDEAVVQILCEWAVSSQRSGEHRAMAVAKLLEKRQSDLISGEADAADEKDSVSSANGVPTGLPVFQPLLMRFLDNDAPILGENAVIIIKLFKICKVTRYKQK